MRSVCLTSLYLAAFVLLASPNSAQNPTTATRVSPANPCVVSGYESETGTGVPAGSRFFTLGEGGGCQTYSSISVTGSAKVTPPIIIYPSYTTSPVSGSETTTIPVTTTSTSASATSSSSASATTSTSTTASATAPASTDASTPVSTIPIMLMIVPTVFSMLLAAVL